MSVLLISKPSSFWSVSHLKPQNKYITSLILTCHMTVQHLFNCFVPKLTVDKKEIVKFAYNGSASVLAEKC